MSETTTCPNCGWLVDQPLSRIDIAPAVASVAEGDEGAAGARVTFTITRSGPEELSCQVDAAWGGAVDPEDFVAGTKWRGVLHWDEGDTTPVTIYSTLKPDRTFEADELVTVTLSNPVNCTIGAAEAATTVINDDPEPPPPPEPDPVPPPFAGYNGDLPYGGLGIGTASLVGQPGNQKVYTESSIMIACERDGSIAAISWQNRINGHGRTGYSDGDGGTISWICRVVPDPDAGVIKPGPILGTTRRIKAAATTAGWTEEYKAVGGKGGTPLKFVELPTLRFEQPFAVRRGQMLLFTQRQHGGGAVSINNNYSTCHSFADWSPFAFHKSCRQFYQDSMSNRRQEHFPVILVGYTDGLVKGTGVIGYSAGLGEEQESINLDGKTRARQVFVCPDWADGRRIERVVSFWGRTTTQVNGSLRCRIRLAGSDPGGAGDEGQALSDSVLLASQVAYRPTIKMGSKPAPLLRHDFTRPVKLQVGKTYYVVMETVGGSTIYRGARCARWLSELSVGLRQADWAMQGMEGQRNAGDGWKGLAQPTVQDIPVWCQLST